MKKITSLIAICCISAINTFAQSFGVESDNFGGIHSVIFNPANVADSRLKSEFNLFSTNVSLGNDYVGITLGNVTKAFKDNFKFEKDLERFPQEKNNFSTELGVLLTSFMFNINKSNSIALTSRVRSHVNINNVNGEILEEVINDFNTNTLNSSLLNFDLSSLNINTNAWLEVGLTYGRTIFEKNQHFLKGGLSLKYLIGAGFAQASSNNLKGTYDESQNLLTTTGSFNFSTIVKDNNDPNSDDSFKLDTKNNGFASDIGFIYEWRPNFNKFDKEQVNYKGLNKYKLKIGLSVTDIGSITYKNITSTKYDFNNSVNTDIFDTDFQNALDNNYQNTKTIGNVKVKLPTTLRFNADYNITNRFYTSLNYTYSLNNDEQELANRTINTISITPRFESKWISCYIPISFNEYKGANVGLGFRLGILMVGSGTIVSNLISNNAKSLNVYAGLKIPIYHRSKLKTKKS